MNSTMKIAAENLLKIADDLERRTMDETYFVCDKCNHTANLTSINKVRNEVGKRANVKCIRPITANEILSCAVPGCDGTMFYVATEESEKYWINAAEDSGEDIAEETLLKKDNKKEDKGELEVELDKEDGVVEKNKDYEGKSDYNNKSTSNDNLEIIDDDEGEIDTEKDSKKKKTENKKDKPDDGEVSLPKKNTPKFEKMPKEADFQAAVDRYSFIPER